MKAHFWGPVFLFLCATFHRIFAASLPKLTDLSAATDLTDLSESVQQAGKQLAEHRLTDYRNLAEGLTKRVEMIHYLLLDKQQPNPVSKRLRKEVFRTNEQTWGAFLGSAIGELVRMIFRHHSGEGKHYKIQSAERVLSELRAFLSVWEVKDKRLEEKGFINIAALSEDKGVHELRKSFFLAARLILKHQLAEDIASSSFFQHELSAQLLLRCNQIEKELGKPALFEDKFWEELKNTFPEKILQAAATKEDNRVTLRSDIYKLAMNIMPPQDTPQQ